MRSLLAAAVVVLFISACGMGEEGEPSATAPESATAASAAPAVKQDALCSSQPTGSTGYWYQWTTFCSPGSEGVSGGWLGPGDNAFVQGTATYQNIVWGGGSYWSSSTDYCYSANTLVEYYCAGPNLAQRTYNCPCGCVNGHCVQ